MFDFDVKEWVVRFWRSLVFVVGNVELDQFEEGHEVKPKDKELKVKVEVGACVHHPTANSVVRMGSLLQATSGVGILWLANLRLTRRILFDKSVNYIGRYGNSKPFNIRAWPQIPSNVLMNSLSKPSRRAHDIALPNSLCRKEKVPEPAILL